VLGLPKKKLPIIKKARSGSGPGGRRRSRTPRAGTARRRRG
jgi:hypothetical protein